jgi:hypothetical protein
MKGIRKKIVSIILVGITILSSCISGLEPIPSDVKDLTMSWSVPVGKAEVGSTNLYGIGPQNYWLGNDKVPDWAKFDYLYFSDTVPVNLARIYDISSTISYLSFRINIWNEYPASCTVNMHFADALGDTIQPPFETMEIEKGSILGVSQNGTLVRPSFKSDTTSFNSQQIEKLRSVEYLVFKVKFNNKQTPDWSFQFFGNYKFTCQLGARVDFIYNDI